LGSCPQRCYILHQSGAPPIRIGEQQQNRELKKIHMRARLCVMCKHTRHTQFSTEQDLVVYFTSFVFVCFLKKFMRSLRER
jgi:hypothetical protein